MKLAHIMPISLLSALPESQRLHLVLSELVLSNEAYFRFYAHKAGQGDTIILDNPVHEDRSVSIDTWLESVTLLMPSVAVIPDVIDSGLMTRDNAREAVAKFKKHRLENIALMAVPHGESQSAWLRCAIELARIPEVTWLGISLERRLQDDQQALIRRRERVQMLYDHSRIFDGIKLHLLGTSERGDEFSGDPIWRRAYSADSSKFVVWNLAGTPVTPPVPIKAAYPGRKPFGGGYGYFFTGHPQGLSRRKLIRNLRIWSEYAEREDG